ncbi:MAG: hypothetical protein RLZZ324_1294 [Candidatus Parcubacteria bacterium]|jgi:redox-sensitive bicupin YhaK (pirin superfamily)
MGFGPLRVINEDRIAPKEGFGRHFHADMEILTYVISGSLEHGDNLGNSGQIRPDQMQYMSAGHGVLHSEKNPGDEPVHLLQIWILPNVLGAKPRYAERDLGAAPKGALQLLASGDGRDGSMEIRQDADVWRGAFGADDAATFTPRFAGKQWIQVMGGELLVGDDVLREGDGLGVEDEPSLLLRAAGHAQFLLFDMTA